MVVSMQNLTHKVILFDFQADKRIVNYKNLPMPPTTSLKSNTRSLFICACSFDSCPEVSFARTRGIRDS